MTAFGRPTKVAICSGYSVQSLSCLKLDSFTKEEYDVYEVHLIKWEPEIKKTLGTVDGAYWFPRTMTGNKQRVRLLNKIIKDLKKKRIKKKKGWLNFYPEGTNATLVTLYKTKKEAINSRGSACVAIVKVKYKLL